MENYPQYFAEIIKASSASPLGILALIILIIGVLAYHFFRKERTAIKLTVFFTLVGLSLVSFAMSFYSAEVFIPNVDHLADAGDTSGDTSKHSTNDEPVSEVPSAPSRPSVAMVPSARPAQPTLSKSHPSVRTLESVTESTIESRPMATPPSTERIARSRVTLANETAAVTVRQDCSAAWSGWIDIGKGVGNPCPADCKRGDELGKSIRMVGFPPRPQAKHEFQCWK